MTNQDCKKIGVLLQMLETYVEEKYELISECRRLQNVLQDEIKLIEKEAEF